MIPVATWILIYIDIMNSIADATPLTARQQRAIVWGRIIELLGRGVSTGSKMLDRMLLQGRDTVDVLENVYHLDYVPSPAEHFERQDPGEAGTIFRPSLMVSISDEEFNWDVLDALAELGRNVLAGRAVLHEHPCKVQLA